jgi:hypothetical protein
VRFRCFALVSAAAAVVAVVMLAPVPGAAQQKTAPPLTAWGAPDLQGVWDFRSLTPTERPSGLKDKEVFSDEEAETFAQEQIKRQSRDRDTSGRVVPYNDFWFDEGTKVTTQRTSLIVDPPDGRMPPMTPQGEKKRAAEQEARRKVGADLPPPGGWVADMSPTTRCIVGFNSGPPMRPSAYNNNMQLIQSRDYVAIVTEMVHDARIIPLDARPHLAQGVRQWMGDSRGRWQGQTLVVETTNFRPDRTPFGGSATTRLTERFTRANADTLLYEVTVEDPTTWTKPWTFRVPMAYSKEPLYEYACHEGNYGLYNILSGVGKEREAAKTKSR